MIQSISFLGLNSYVTAGITAGMIVLVSIASFLSVLYYCKTWKRKPRSIQVHVSSVSSQSDDHIPVFIGTLGVPSVTALPTLQPTDHQGKNQVRSFSPAHNQELL